MNGLIALVGSGEYLPVMDPVDRYLLEHCGADGKKPRVVCLPTAAGEEGDASVDRWLRMGVEHFTRLGAHVQAARITNRAEADEPQYAEMLEQADLVYFSGGHPTYLYQTMQGSQAWQAAEKAWGRGAVYAGCSAGAMILGANIPDFRSLGLRQQAAFGVFPNSVIFPHFDRMMTMRGVVMPLLQSRLGKEEYSLGIDEETALVGKLGGEWTVMGRSKVYLITRKEVKAFSAGETVPVPA
ncbi:MAG TPA: Type 1 glutamine amidotransferase-like domain-containing protein [Anaerolineales bacterium]|nr:Type 1 glutamine amidotransferase-like domain-containing protein [Anaerolineales bacterium]